MTDNRQVSLRSTQMGQIGAALHLVQKAESECDILMYHIGQGELEPNANPVLLAQGGSKLAALRNRLLRIADIIAMIEASSK